MSSKTQLESLLIKRGLGATLLGPEQRQAYPNVGPFLRPGTISELVPAADSTGAGITSFALHLAAGHAGKIAWIDPMDRLDSSSAAGSGVVLPRLLWLRRSDTTVALQAAQLIVQAGGFGLVVVDFLDQEDRMLCIPRAAWFRLLRALERERRTALLMLAPRPLSGSCADCVLAVHYAGWVWDEAAQPLLDKVRIGTLLRQSRREAHGDGKRPPQSVGGTPLLAEFIA